MNWTIFFLMLPHLKPKCLDIIWPELYRGLDVLRILSLLVLVAMFLRRFVREKKLPSPVSWMLAVLEGWICLNALLKKGDYIEVFSIAVSVMAVTLLIDYYSALMQELLTALMLNYEWIVYANLISVIAGMCGKTVLDPDYDWIRIYFFGPDNWFMYLCIPAVCIALMYLRLQFAVGKIRSSILRSGCLIAVSYATVILTWPATAVVSMAILGFVALLGLIPSVQRCITFPVALVCGLAANLSISVFRVAEAVPMLADFIQIRLKKNITFSGRTYVWDSFWEQMSGHLWTGIGNPAEGYYLANRAYDHIHNQYYDMLALGGIIALGLFLGVLLLSGWKLTHYKKTWSARIMTAVMSALLIMCIPEVLRNGTIYLIFPLAFHVDKLEFFCQKMMTEEADES